MFTISMKENTGNKNYILDLLYKQLICMVKQFPMEPYEKDVISIFSDQLKLNFNSILKHVRSINYMFEFVIVTWIPRGRTKSVILNFIQVLGCFIYKAHYLLLFPSLFHVAL